MTTVKTVELHPSRVDYNNNIKTTIYAFDIFAKEAAKFPVTSLRVTATKEQLDDISSPEEEAKVVENWNKVIGVIKSNQIDWIQIKGSIPAPLLNVLLQLEHPKKINALSFEKYDGEKSKWQFAPCKTYTNLKELSFVDSNAVGMNLEQCGSVESLDVERSQAFAKAHPDHSKMIDFILEIAPQLNGVTELIVLGEGEATLPEVVAKADQLSEQLPNLKILTTSITAATLDSRELKEALDALDGSDWLSKIPSIRFEFTGEKSETTEAVIKSAQEKLCRQRGSTSSVVEKIIIVSCEEKK